MHQEEIRIENRRGEKLAGILHKAKGKKLMIVCHGAAATKSYPLIVSLCETLIEKDINAFRFDFSGCGDSQGAFIEKTYTNEVDDLEAVIDYFYNLGYDVGIIGHSQGGSICLIEASNDDRVELVVSVAARGYTKHYIDKLDKKTQKTLKEGGNAYWFESELGQQFPFRLSFIEDVMKYDIVELIKNMGCPILFMQGDNDTIREAKETDEMFENANDPKEKSIIKGADHFFSKKTEQTKVTKAAIKFILKYTET